MEKTALVIRHIDFENLGNFARPLEAAGYTIQYEDIGHPDFCTGDPLQADLLIILGGPIGVYEDDIYPFLIAERKFIKGRLESGRPTLGVCLGAQLIASALGAKVFASGVKEIEFSHLHLTEEGRSGALRHLDGVPVLHWHGDTYILPPEARNLASTPVIAQQAFAIGSNILGLQFHAEADTGTTFERWLVGHAVELAAAGIDRGALREMGLRYETALRDASSKMLAEWLAGLDETS